MEFIPIILIAFLFWFLLIRPQSKRQREMARMQSSLGPGDRVMLQSGIYATVFGVDEEQGRLQLELAPGVVVEAARGSVGAVESQVERPEDDEARTDDADATNGDPGDNGADGSEGGATR